MHINLRDINFEWDDNKNLINIRKHGISFEEAMSVFFFEDSVVFDDPDHTVQEERFLIIGFSDRLQLCIVSWCERTGNVIRIISARKATKSETEDFMNYS